MLTNVRNVYFSGINGIGMSGLAKILVKEGYNVAGSDLERKAITQEMEEMGIKIYIGQVEENVKDKGIDLFVYSTATAIPSNLFIISARSCPLFIFFILFSTTYLYSGFVSLIAVE